MTRPEDIVAGATDPEIGEERLIDQRFRDAPMVMSAKLPVGKVAAPILRAPLDIFIANRGGDPVWLTLLENESASSILIEIGSLEQWPAFRSDKK